MTRRPLGASGSIAKAFLESKLTPLLVVFSLLLGAFAVLITPREEEPQIKVPMIDVMVGFPGAAAGEALWLIRDALVHETRDERGRAVIDRDKLPLLSQLYSTCTSTVENAGHRFGEDLSADDKQALTAFLATL